jgi:tetratricopeptide (TPR) repeat protein
VSRRAALLAVAALSLAAPAGADPSLWQRAKDPGAQARARARLRAEQLFDQATGPRADPETLQQLSLGSAALLELSGGAQRDPWQEVLLGRVLLEARAGRAKEAMHFIESGLRSLPDSDFKGDSLFDLGLGAMLGGDMEQANKAFSAALPLAWEPDDRATLLRNRGKARMLSGHLLEAVADFRAALKLARHVEVIALGEFSLGVALERSGDYPQGMQEIARGASVHLPVPPFAAESVLDLPTVTILPDYDLYYYRALGAMAEAAAADGAELQKDRYAAALESWEQYLPAAEAQRDRFVPNAERHRQRCIDVLARLKKAEPGRGKSSRGVR